MRRKVRCSPLGASSGKGNILGVCRWCSARHLFTAGYAVIIHETPNPAALRRGMSFTDAIFDGAAWLEQVKAVRIDHPKDVRGAVLSHTALPVTVMDLAKLRQVLPPRVLVDARMRKHLKPECQRGIAPLTIGLGPNFIAGETVDVAIETNWGDQLGGAIYRAEVRYANGRPA